MKKSEVQFQHASGFSFEVLATDGDARAGRLITPHGVIETPSFVAVGTLGTVRGICAEDLEAAGGAASSRITCIQFPSVVIAPTHARRGPSCRSLNQ